MTLLVCTSLFHVLLTCFLAAITTRTSDAAAGAAQLQASNCTFEGTPTDDYAANLNQLLAKLPSTTVSKNGGFFNGTVGQGAATVYGLALCSADFSRSDCDDCLTAASSSASGLLKRCPGSLTASIMFDQCMLRYSNRNFFGSNETDIIYKSTTSEIVPFRQALSNNLKQGLAYLSAQAALSPERFAASGTAPYALVQCTWDLPSDKCKACIDTLSANASDLFEVAIEGELKSYSCRVRYSNTSFTVVPLVAPAPAPAPTMNRSADPTGGPGPPTSASSRNSNKAIVVGVVTVITAVVLLLVALFCVRRGRSDKFERLHPNKKGETQMDGTSTAQHREEDRSDMQPGARVMNNSNNVNLHLNVHPAGVSVMPGANNASSATTTATGGNTRGPPPSSSAMEADADQQQQADHEDRSTMQLQLARQHGDPDIATTWGNNSSSALPKDMALEFLRRITDNFSEQKILGRGTFGTVYKGEHNGKSLAVKLLRSLNPAIEIQEREFKNEFENLWKLKHPNIVRLLGYCYETKRKCIEQEGEPRLAHIIDRALCFEFMHKGSLQQHLADESCGLEWQTRYKIIKGTCEGLKYLHKGFEKPMLHLDLKPGNILLDKNMVPKLADFGLSKFVGDNQTQATSSPLGTIRYCPPEHFMGNLFSTKFDIFSLGVVIIEVIAGSKGYDKTAEMSSHEFIDHVQENWRKRIHKATSFCTSPKCECYQVKRCIETALQCVHHERTERPDIGDIISLLNETENNFEKSATTSSRNEA